MVTATMVGLDASDDQPRIVSTFTTRDPLTPAELNEANDYIRRLVRSELGPARSLAMLEFTTGRAATSGGQRRPHFHTLWKDVDGDAAPLIAGVAGHVLGRASGAFRHDVQPIRSPAGATMYVARHHLKESQAPPPWWGPTRRVRPSRGYWSRPAKQLREEAVALVREKRLARRIRELVDRAEEEVGDLSDLGDELLEKALAQPAAEVVRVRESAGRMVEVLAGVR